jgi:peptidoglycan/LPS O-acetylase OafA/YrhL
MGLIRLFLAMCVVVWHSGGVAGWFPYNGTACVILFFIISGFYMTLILNEKYLGAGSHMLFLRNRFFRLWPSFIVAAAITLPLMPHVFSELYHESNGLAFLVILTSNITMLAYEIKDLLCLGTTGHLQFCPVGHPEAVKRFFLIQQGWSIGLEIWFYLIAPFVVIGRWRVAFFLLVGAVMFVFGRAIHLDELWIYRSFPPVFLFFMLGALAYHVGKQLKQMNCWSAYDRFGGYVILPLTLIAIAIPNVMFGWLPQQHHNKVFIALFVLFIPAWFSWSKRHSWDTAVGDLSYPIYIVHLAVISWIINFWNLKGWLSCATIVASILAAFILLHGLERPIDRWRQKNVRLLRSRQHRPILQAPQP